jgi:hypothetical protein
MRVVEVLVATTFMMKTLDITVVEPALMKKSHRQDEDIETDLRKGNVWNSFLSLNQQLVDQVKSPSDYKIYRSGLHKLHAELLANKRKPGEQIQGVASLPSVSITTKSNKRKKRITSPKKRRRFSLKGIGIEK